MEQSDQHGPEDFAKARWVILAGILPQILHPALINHPRQAETDKKPK